MSCGGNPKSGEEFALGQALKLQGDFGSVPAAAGTDDHHRPNPRISTSDCDRSVGRDGHGLPLVPCRLPVGVLGNGRLHPRAPPCFALSVFLVDRSPGDLGDCRLECTPSRAVAKNRTSTGGRQPQQPPGRTGIGRVVWNEAAASCSTGRRSRLLFEQSVVGLVFGANPGNPADRSSGAAVWRQQVTKSTSR